AAVRDERIGAGRGAERVGRAAFRAELARVATDRDHHALDRGKADARLEIDRIAAIRTPVAGAVDRRGRVVERAALAELARAVQAPVRGRAELEPVDERV